MFKATFACRLMLLCLLAFLAVPAHADPTVFIAVAGDGVFTLEGTDLINAAVIDVAISYDGAVLSKPRVTQGRVATGAMAAANLNRPGLIQLSIIGSSAINGSGPLATITFDRNGASPGRVTLLTASITDREGNAASFGHSSDSLVASTAGAPASGSVDQAEEKWPVQGAIQPLPPGVGQSAAHPRIVGGTVTLADERAEKGDEPKNPVVQPERDLSEPRAAAPPPPEPDKVEASQPKAAVPAAQPLQSVLERFQRYQGERTAEGLSALFARDDAPYQQQPAVLISDGIGTIAVTILDVAGENAPRFTFNAARAVSVTSAGGGRWQVVVKPDRDALKACIGMLLNNTVLEFPLAVAPQADVDLDRSGKVTEADFNLFQRERGTAAAPRFDLNRDGKRDYLDDYIFIANYLVSREKLMKEEAARRKSDPPVVP